MFDLADNKIGRFWLASNPSLTVPGILSWSASSGAKIELLDSLQPKNGQPAQKNEVIHGELLDGLKRVTILYPTILDGVISHYQHEEARLYSTVHSNTIIVGRHLSQDSKILGFQFKTDVDESFGERRIFQWEKDVGLARLGEKERFIDVGALTCHYASWEIKFSAYLWRSAFDRRNVGFASGFEWTLKPKSAKKLGDGTDLIYRIVLFLSVISRRPVKMVNLKCDVAVDPLKDKELSEGAEVYSVGLPLSAGDHSAPHWQQLIFDSVESECSPSKAIQRWLWYYPRLEYANSLMSVVLYEGYVGRIYLFQSLMQVLESIHRFRFRNVSKVADPRFKSWSENVSKDAKLEFGPLLGGMVSSNLKMAGDYTLRERLCSILDYYTPQLQAHVEALSERNNLIPALVHTRNRYSHGLSPSDLRHSVDLNSIEGWKLVRALRAIVDAEMLRIMDVPNKYIEDRIKGLPYYPGELL